MPSPNSRKFLYHLFRTSQAISKKTAMPRMADTRDESLPFQPVCYFIAVLLSSPLIADFATQLWHSRWARFKFWSSDLRFTSASTIPRAFEFNGAGKHLNPKLQIKWYNSIRFDHSVFLGKKSSHPFVKWSPPKILCFNTVFYPTNFPTYWDSKVEKLQAAETVICGPLAHIASLPIF